METGQEIIENSQTKKSALVGLIGAALLILSLFAFSQLVISLMWGMLNPVWLIVNIIIFTSSIGLMNYRKWAIVTLTPALLVAIYGLYTTITIHNFKIIYTIIFIVIACLLFLLFSFKKLR